uniref:Conotoxin n=1 Tax=Conus andremenezi TaxID=1077466 RepID=A0A291C1Q1_9COND|nr:conotoxin [Conus andremenezi]
MNTAGRLLLLCLALGLVFESLGKAVPDDVNAERDTDPFHKDARQLEILTEPELDCGGVTCKASCCVKIDEEEICTVFDCIEPDPQSLQ